MPDVVVAVFENLFMRDGTGLVVGDLVLTTERVCYVELASWQPSPNLLTLTLATLGAPQHAGAITALEMAERNPDAAHALASADARRPQLWGMTLDDRLRVTRSKRTTLRGDYRPAEEETQIALGDRRRTTLLAASDVVASVNSVLREWHAGTLSLSPVEGFQTQWLPPKELLLRLRRGGLAMTHETAAAMLGDGEYMAHLDALFTESGYGAQTRVIRALHAQGALPLASHLEGTHVKSLKEKHGDANATGCVIAALLFVVAAGCAIFGVVAARVHDPAGCRDSLVAGFAFVLAGCAFIWVTRKVSVVRLKRAGLDVKAVEAEQAEQLKKKKAAESQPPTEPHSGS